MSEILYLKIYNTLKEEILSGSHASGSKLMGIRELSDHYHTSHKTISRALDRLEEEGFIRVTQGQGIFVLEREQWLHTPKSGTIGLILNDMKVPFNVRLTSVLEQRAAEKGYTISVRSSGYDAGRQQNITREFISADVSGLVIVPAGTGGDASPASEAADTPAVYIGEFTPSDSFPGNYISVDSYTGFYNAARFLMASGHEIIGYIGASADMESEPGYHGCRDALLGRRKGYFKDYFLSAGGYDTEQGVQAMGELLLREEYPTAVLCSSDTLAAGALRACRAAGLSVPEDVCLIGSGDQDVASLIEPQLTTIKTPAELLGSITLHIMEDLILRRLPAAERIRLRLDTELILRESTGDLSVNMEDWL